MYNVIILCGGGIGPLRDLGIDYPKNMLDINGKSVIERQVDYISEIDIKHVVLSVGYQAPRLIMFCQRAFAENGVLDKLKIHVESEGLGTGGAVKYAFEKLGDDLPLIVLNGDTLFQEPLSNVTDMLVDTTQAVIMAIEAAGEDHHGIIEKDASGALLAFKCGQKPTGQRLINAGVYVLSPKVLQFMPEEESFSLEQTVFPRLLDAKVFVTDKRWVDAGTPVGLKQAKELFR